MESLLSFATFKANKDMKKTDGAKRQRLTGISKLDDANDAGGRNSEDCTLILTEGDSAKALAVRLQTLSTLPSLSYSGGWKPGSCRLPFSCHASPCSSSHLGVLCCWPVPLQISGLSVVGRNKYGVFPLRGKLLNVRDASSKQIMDNTEISNIKQIMGLQQGKEYTNTKSLRYGHLMIMTDQVSVLRLLIVLLAQPPPGPAASCCHAGSTILDLADHLRVLCALCCMIGPRRLAHQGTHHQLPACLLALPAEAAQLPP